MRLAALVALSLLVERLLGGPGAPPWLGELLIPVVWLVAPPLLTERRRWPYLGIAVGLGCDVLLEPVIGPGGIAWGAGYLAVTGLAGLVADRSLRAWLAFGGIASLVIVLARQLALVPLGLASMPNPAHLVRSALLNAAWCALVGATIKLDLPSRWRRYRTRRLR